MKQKLLNKLWLRVGMIVAIMTTALSGTARAETTTYTFTNNSWTDSNSAWKSDKAGYGYSSSSGVQVTANYSGAGATSNNSFSNITSIKVNACTTSKGVGNITVKVGEGSAQTICSLSKNATPTDYTLNYNTPVSGEIAFVVNCTTNSMYLKSISVTTESGSNPSTYTVTYDANGGTGEMTDDDSPYESGATVTVLDNEFTRDGYDFAGWNTETDGTGTDYTEGATFNISANTILYAQWEEAAAAGTKKLTFDVSSNPGEWPTANSTTLTEYTYTLNSVDYTFALKNVKCNSGYLMMTQPAALGLPALPGYKLTKVEVKNSGGCSTATEVGISSTSSSASYISGGAAQTWSTTSTTYTYTLSSTAENTMYYMYVTTKNAQVTEIKLTYEEAERTYSVTYDANGADSGTVPTDDTEYTDASNTVTVLGNTGSLAKAGYTFGGWNTQADGNGTNYTAGNTFTISDNTTLYAKWNVKTCTNLTYTGTPTKTAYYGGESFDPTGMVVTATYNDESTENVTTSVTWSPDPLTVGTTSVTGTFMGRMINVNGLTVTVAPGTTQQNPYTVAQAIDNTPSSGTSSNVYIHGIVSAFYSNGESILSDDNNYRYYISDDGTTSTQLVVYKGKGLNNETFSNEDDLLVGDEIVIYGKLNTYNQAPQVASGSYIVSLTRAKQDPTIPSTPVSVAYGSTHTVTGIVAGEATLTSSNTAVATVEGLVITPVAVGTTTITVTTEENTYYNAGSGTFELTVTAPVGGTTAPTGSAGGTIFEETFESCAGTGGNDDTWSGTIAQDAFGDAVTDEDGWTCEHGNAASGCAKFGTGKAGGSATTPTLGQAGTFTLTFKAAAWNGSSEGTTLYLSADNATLMDAGGENLIDEVTLVKGAWTTYTLTLMDAEADATITFYTSTGNHRFFLDEVKVEAPATPAPEIKATLNGSGYATFCSEYPLDFSEAEENGYSAWQITAANSSTGVITFSKITGSVKGGQGILLKGTAGKTIELSSVGSTNTLSGNKLYGTLAPTYVAANEYYGLSGQSFVKVNAGTVPAGKALLPASVVDGSSVKAFTFVFEDDATGINEELRMKNEESSIYNLAGQRLDNSQFTIHNSQLKRGIYIVNGKKVLK